jgi:hypothetical protein
MCSESKLHPRHNQFVCIFLEYPHGLLFQIVGSANEATSPGSGLHAPMHRLGFTYATFAAASLRKHLFVCYEVTGIGSRGKARGRKRRSFPWSRLCRHHGDPQHRRSSFLFLLLLLLLVTITALSCLSVTPLRRHDYWFLVPGFFYRSQLPLLSPASILAVVGTCGGRTNRDQNSYPMEILRQDLSDDLTEADLLSDLQSDPPNGDSQADESSAKPGLVIA